MSRGGFYFSLCDMSLSLSANTQGVLGTERFVSHYKMKLRVMARQVLDHRVVAIYSQSVVWTWASSKKVELRVLRFRR